jgi:hypothetical protein
MELHGNLTETRLVQVRTMGTPHRFLAVLVLAALAAVSCAGLRSDPRAGGIDHPTGASDLILRVHVGGGFVPVDYTLREIPFFSIYGDGRLVTVGPQIEIYPGPALPNLLVSQISEEGIQAILEAARDAGLLGPDRRFDHPGIADAHTTTFTLVAEGRTHVISAYALGFDEQPSGLIPEDEQQARQKLNDFQMKLGDLGSWLPEGSVGEEEPFGFDELRIFVREDAPKDDALPQNELRWPLSPGLADFGAVVPDLDVRCGSVQGSDLEALLPLAQEANELTPWRNDDHLYGLVFRPLLPDESGCEGAADPLR